MRVLLVEDEPEMAAALTVALKNYDMVVDHISTLADAEEAVSINDYGAILLDRQLPDGDGLTLIPKLRARGIGVPVIVLTARGELADRIAGLDTGADDYLGKPFAVEELLARLRAVLRRPADLPPETIQTWPAVVRPRQPGSQRRRPASRSAAPRTSGAGSPAAPDGAHRRPRRRWRRRSTASMTRSSRTRWIPMFRGCAGNCPRPRRKLKSTAFAASAIC